MGATSEKIPHNFQSDLLTRGRIMGCRDAGIQVPRFTLHKESYVPVFGPQNPVALLAHPSTHVFHVLEQKAVASALRILGGPEAVQPQQKLQTSQ